MGRRLVDRAARLLDDEERDVVQGDFAELGTPARTALREVLGLIARRQAAAWADWRPWATCVGFVLPIAALIMFVANWLGRNYDLYFWIFRNHADIDPVLLSDLGLTIPHGVFLLITQSLLKYSRRGFVSVGVAMDEEGWQKVKPYLAQHPINYPIVIGDAELARRFNVTALPVTLLIDRAGRIADAHAGMVVKDAWEQEIQTLLREPR